jgi:hypothetical protein
MNTINRHKRKILTVDPNLVIRLISLLSGNPGQVRVEAVKLPDDVQVVGVYYNPARNTYDAIILSETFDAVAEGEEAPRIESETTIGFLNIERHDEQERVEAAAKGALHRGRPISLLSRRELCAALVDCAQYLPKQEKCVNCGNPRFVPPKCVECGHTVEASL